MATTAIWAVHSRLDHLVDYVSNLEKTANAVFDDLHDVLEYAGDDYKTEQKYFVSGVNCNPETAYDAMNAALRLNDKPLKILGFHGYQSFQEGEVTAEVAHEIGMKLAQELWGDKFQVVVSTHCNTNHFHNHFVVCGTSFVDGSRYPASKETYRKMRDTSDRLCQEYGLSVVQQPKRGTGKHYAEWDAQREERATWRGLIKADIDTAISRSLTDKQFFYKLKQMGYAYKIGKDISVRPPGKQRFVRLARNFGEEYTMQGIRRQILNNPLPKKQPPPPPRQFLLLRCKGKRKGMKKVGGLRGLYLHYCYLLGIIPKKRQTSPAQMNFLLREDLLKLDNIIAQTRLLAHNKIETSQQLVAFQGQKEQDIKVRTDLRKQLRLELRKTSDPEQQKILKEKIAALSGELKQLRQEVKHTQAIAERSGLMRETVRELQHQPQEKVRQENQKKGASQHEAAKAFAK